MAVVFWSWQSDLDARVTRNLARAALAEAIDTLCVDLEDAERPELTSDTKGVPGTPDIVATIFEKIDGAAIFVADLTPIAATGAGKALPNPNVLIELGYAKKALGPSRIINVWNTAFPEATPEQLPFDLRGRRAPIAFELAAGASTGELRAARTKLARELADALRSSLQTLPAAPKASALWQPSFRDCPALWFDPAEPLKINEGGMGGAKLADKGPYAYARLLPAAWTKPSDFGVHYLGLLGRTMGCSWGRTAGGSLTYDGSIRVDSGTLNTFTIQFAATGEIWGVDSHISKDGDRPILWAYDLLRGWRDFLTRHAEMLSKLNGALPLRVKLGIYPLSNLTWPNHSSWSHREQALENEFECDFELRTASQDELMEKLHRCWSDLGEAFGHFSVDQEQFQRDLQQR